MIPDLLPDVAGLGQDSCTKPGSCAAPSVVSSAESVHTECRPARLRAIPTAGCLRQILRIMQRTSAAAFVDVERNPLARQSVSSAAAESGDVLSCIAYFKYDFHRGCYSRFEFGVRH